MRRAWRIARDGVKNFGGKVSEYFAISLKMAWAEIKDIENKIEICLSEFEREVNNDIICIGRMIERFVSENVKDRSNTSIGVDYKIWYNSTCYKNTETPNLLKLVKEILSISEVRCVNIYDDEIIRLPNYIIDALNASYKRLEGIEFNYKNKISDILNTKYATFKVYDVFGRYIDECRISSLIKNRLRSLIDLKIKIKNF